MATERKLHKVWFFPAIWDGQLIRNWDQGIPYIGYDEAPEWLRERAAVLRLLNENEESPLGSWSIVRRSDFTVDHDYLIVRQPGDPKWGEW